MPSLSGIKIYDTDEPCNYTGQKLVEAMTKVVDDRLSENQRELDLKGCCVGINGLQVIGEDPRIANIKRLNLGGNKIGDAGAHYLAENEVFAKLNWLELGGNDLGTEGIRAIIKSKILKKLKTLNLYRNYLKDEGPKSWPRKMNWRKSRKWTSPRMKLETKVISRCPIRASFPIWSLFIWTIISVPVRAGKAPVRVPISKNCNH